MPKTPVKKDKGRKIIVTIVNSIIDLPCLRDSSPCFTDSRASTTPACLYPASVRYIEKEQNYGEVLTAVSKPRDPSRRRKYSLLHSSRIAALSTDLVSYQVARAQWSSSN
jgi:hypothetical protein